MKKPLIAAVAVVALAGIAVVGGAALTGAQAKKRLQAAPLAWQAQWPMIKVLEQHYDRGLFGATHTVTLQFGCEAANPGGAAAPLLLTLRQRVQHGPLPGLAGIGAVAVDTEVLLPEAARKQLSALIGNQAPFSAHTLVGFDGASDTRFAMPQFKSTGPEGQQLAFQGITGSLRDRGGVLQYEFSMPGFTLGVHDARMAMEMRLAGARMHGELGGGAMWARPGKGEGDMAAMEMSVTPQDASMPPLKLALHDLHFSSDNRLDKALLDGVARFTAQGTVNDVKLDKIELQASVKRLHAPSYERLMQRLMDMSAATCDMKQAISPQVMLAEMQQDLVALLPYNPEYALDKLAVESGGRRAELSYAVGMEGVTPEDAKLPLAALLGGKAHFRGRARLPLAWAQAAMLRFGANAQGPADPAAQADMAEVMLAKMTGDGFVVRDGDMLATEFSFEKGQMLVNGKPLGRPPAQ
ncbi:MAG TPA: DUF945 family protein [Albitalea sp.]|nr:DUF945 family protein [Albitalea sp.]